LALLTEEQLRKIAQPAPERAPVVRQPFVDMLMTVWLFKTAQRIKMRAVLKEDGEVHVCRSHRTEEDVIVAVDVIRIVLEDAKMRTGEEDAS